MRRAPFLATLIVLAAPAGAVAAPLRLSVAYTGAGSNRTHYVALSPNPGGAPDHDDATDTDVERGRGAVRTVHPQRPTVTVASSARLTGTDRRA